MLFPWKKKYKISESDFNVEDLVGYNRHFSKVFEKLGYKPFKAISYACVYGSDLPAHKYIFVKTGEVTDRIVLYECIHSHRYKIVIQGRRFVSKDYPCAYFSIFNDFVNQLGDYYKCLSEFLPKRNYKVVPTLPIKKEWRIKNEKRK